MPTKDEPKDRSTPVPDDAGVPSSAPSEGQTPRAVDNDNPQPFIPPEEGTAHGYWGQRARNTIPNDEMTVAGVTRNLSGPSGTAQVDDKGSDTAKAQQIANTAALRGNRT